MVRMLVTACFLVGVASGLEERTGKLIPAGAQAEMMRQAGGGTGGGAVDHGHDKGEACGLMAGCADIQCYAPFELKRGKGQCCPTCFAPDHAVAIDRHTAMQGPNPFHAKPALAAPASCMGVKCFKPVCLPNFKPGQVPGACCNSCKPAGLLQRSAKLIPAGAQAEMMRQAGGGVGGGAVDHGHDKGEACGLMAGCADIQCYAPFELKRGKGQCCPTCFAPDHAVAIDRHTAMQGPNPFHAKPALAAPASCMGVKCFKPVCLPNFKPGQVPGACCNSCKPGLLQTRTAPDVESEVAKERMSDVYIHDGFGEMEKTDTQKEKQVRADKDLKP